MKNKILILILSLGVVLLSSCAPKNTAKKSFTFKMSAMQTGIPLTGGSFVKASGGGGASESLIQLDATDSAEFPFGTWTFQTISYQGPSPLAGKRYCGGVQGINVGAVEQNIEISINEANCLVEPFLTFIADIDTKFGSKVFIVNSVQFIDNQVVINGNQLDKVANVNINGQGLNETFSIESKSATKIIANSLKAVSFDVAKVFNLIHRCSGFFHAASLKP